MPYLQSFCFASALAEDGVLLNDSRLDMACYAGNNVYPFKVLPQKGVGEIELAPITILYGGNGSGKSTMLNIMAEKLALARTAPFNTTPFMADYLALCRYTLCHGVRAIPQGSAIITSDGVFDYLLDIRAINDQVGRRREELFHEYHEVRHPKEGTPTWQLQSMDDYDELCRRNEIRHRTRSAYTAKRLANELPGKSNGESAFAHFTQRVQENALYLLDEPENSLSATLQAELAKFVLDSARFYHCQFVIATHSPFLLSMKGGKIYDLDSTPVAVKKWTELANVRAYYALFDSHRAEFEI